MSDQDGLGRHQLGEHAGLQGRTAAADPNLNSAASHEARRMARALASQALAQDRERGFVHPEDAVVVFGFP